jgi:hypothetical protein
MIAGKLHRVRNGHRKRFVGTPPVVPAPVRRPARLAVMLALAHKIQQAIDRGAIRDRAEVARRLGLTRARVTQLLDLTLLAPDIQEQILDLQAIDGVEQIHERALRYLARQAGWAEQRTGIEKPATCPNRTRLLGLPLPPMRLCGLRRRAGCSTATSSPACGTDSMRWPRASAPPYRCETRSDRFSPRQRDEGRVCRKLDQAGKSSRRRHSRAG